MRKCSPFGFAPSLALLLLLIHTIVPATAWLPTRDNGLIRGVNLGSHFVVEPWMMNQEWQEMGCGRYKSEADCVAGIGQTAADKTFANHWKSWITENDFKQMTQYGINTVRIPIGYWMKEDEVLGNETFPRGGFEYFQKVAGYAVKYNVYIIIDLHACPGAQAVLTPWTGQMASSAEFYTTSNYERAYNVLDWLTEAIHTNTAVFSTVGTLGLVNEPLQGQFNITSTLTTEYYPNAWKRIRAVEDRLQIPSSSRLHISMMNTRWGAGDPLQGLSDAGINVNNYTSSSSNSSSSSSSTSLSSFALLEDHRWIKYDPTVSPTRQAYIESACTTRTDSRDRNSRLFIGEWAISPAEAVQSTNTFAGNRGNRDWYSRFFAAQMQTYEMDGGWVYWSWRVELNDYRWSYQDAVAVGVIPANLTEVGDVQPCSGDLATGLKIGNDGISSRLPNYRTALVVFLVAIIMGLR